MNKIGLYAVNGMGKQGLLCQALCLPMPFSFSSLTALFHF